MICATGKELLPKDLGTETKAMKEEFNIRSSPEFIKVEN